MKRIKIFAALVFVLVIGFQAGYSQQHTLTVDLKNPGAPIQKTMYGIFFEDINYGADGGLYAEMIKNRSFDFGLNDNGSISK